MSCGAKLSKVHLNQSSQHCKKSHIQVISQKKLPEFADIGNVIPINKPEKNPTLPEVYRRIMLTLLIRKIIAILISNRVFKSAMKRKPLARSAYQPGRDFSGKVLAVKMLYEKALMTVDAPVHTKLIDMSRAFDNLCENLLKEMYKRIMDESSFFLLELLLDGIDVKM